ncbi:hypothetical protein DAETH_11400 [Deinococcus aetherius]|uniref:Uncharacterized protein n=2 Tax=Deinococcus aetherius TaxID=200252 RepID=A0ABN6RHI4_9DEIO|nr:hypothetical protein DAETH_11400 [Deinococcus aetherius]
MVGSALLLASCDRTNVPSNLTNVSGTVVEGSLAASSNGTLALTTSAWTGGAGSVRAYTGEGSQPQNVVTTALAADGKFSLNLPTAPAAGTLSAIAADEFNAEEDNCTGTVTVSTSQARGAALAIGAEGATKSGGITPLSVTSKVDSAGKVIGYEATLGELLYVDRGLTIKGTQTCTNGSDTFKGDIDVSLQQGWNKVSLTLQLNADGALTGLVVRSGSHPSNWVFLNSGSASPLGVQSLKALEKFSLFR